MNQETKFDGLLDDCATEAALYALGTLPQEQAEAVELRLRSGCALCVASFERYAAIAEQLSLSVPPVQPRPELREKLLARLNMQNSVPPAKGIVVRSSENSWEKLPIPGVEVRSLIGENTIMLRMQPGAIFPKHDHPQAEQCFVLSGSITDSEGLTLHAGDFVVMPRDMQHDPIHSLTGCTLLVTYAD